MKIPALIGLGGNLGDRASRLDSALRSLAATPGVELVARSRYHETPPIGGPGGQGAFLNAAAVVAVDPSLSPADVLATLHRIEAEAGRVRAERWGARTLDLDLLLYDSLRQRDPHLRLPHPRMALRRFVLAPAVEAAPGMIDPDTGRSIAELLANLDRRPSVVALGDSVGRVADLSALREALDSSLSIPSGDAEDRWIVTTPDDSIAPPRSPTFEVIAEDDDDEPGPVPRLRLGGSIVGPDAVATLRAVVAVVVTACGATRAGQDLCIAAPSRPTPPHPSPPPQGGRERKCFGPDGF